MANVFAGRFALDACDRARHPLERFRSARGLPRAHRLARGTGVPFSFCPFTKQLSYTGHHVNHAAQIESITVAGEVYASLGFMALASEEHIADLHCEYAGLLALPKRYGTFPVYHVRRRG